MHRIASIALKVGRYSSPANRLNTILYEAFAAANTRGDKGEGKLEGGRMLLMAQLCDFAVSPFHNTVANMVTW